MSGDMLHKGKIVFWTSNLDDATRGKEFAAIITFIHAEPKLAEQSCVNLHVFRDAEYLSGGLDLARVPYSDDPTKRNTWHWVEQQ